MNELGTKDLREVIKASLEMSLFLCIRLKDGVGIDDAAALFDKIKNDEEFKKLFADAYEGYKNVIPEAKDVDLTEGLELSMMLIPYVSKFVAALKKEAK